MIAAVMAVLAVAACSPKQGPSDLPPVQAPGQIDLNAFRGEELEYLTYADGPDEAPTREQIARFEQATGAKVKLQFVPAADMTRTLSSRIASGTPPHAARTRALGPYVDSLVDLTTYFGEQYPQQFLPGLAAAAAYPAGRMVGVPTDLTMNGAIVNVDAFAKAGVSLPSSAKPWTWDEMVKAATAVQRANGMESAIAIDKSGYRLSAVLGAFGTALIGPNGAEGLDPAKAAKMLVKLDDLARSGALQKDLWLGTGRYKAADEQFLAKQVPVYLSGSWQVAPFARNATFGWAAAPNPCAERCGGFPGGSYMVAFSGSDNPDLGAVFVEWMNRADTQRAVAGTAYWLPTRTDLQDAGVSYPQHADDMKTFAAEAAMTPDTAFAAGGNKNFPAAAQVLADQVGRMLAGQQNPQATVTAIKTQVAELIKQNS